MQKKPRRQGQAGAESLIHKLGLKALEIASLILRGNFVVVCAANYDFHARA
jgi:hypothetical protein